MFEKFFTTMFTVIIFVWLLKSIPRFVLIGGCLSELHAYMCPYHNLWPEVVYTRTIMFTNMPPLSGL